MKSHAAKLQLALSDGTPLEACVDDLVIAGWSGRDRSKVEEYVSQLAKGGFEPPSSIPSFYRISASLLTTADTIDVLGDHTSGEVEVVLMATPAGLVVGLGSDHTDRKIARTSVAYAKQLCAKPVARSFWRFDEVLGHWDQLRLSAQVVEDGTIVTYQEGPVSLILPPKALMHALAGGGGEPMPVGRMLFCGTLPVAGAIRPAREFRMELLDPVKGRSIRHRYHVRPISVVN